MYLVCCLLQNELNLSVLKLWLFLHISMNMYVHSKIAKMFEYMKLKHCKAEPLKINMDGWLQLTQPIASHAA